MCVCDGFDRTYHGYCADLCGTPTHSLRESRESNENGKVCIRRKQPVLEPGVRLCAAFQASKNDFFLTICVFFFRTSRCSEGYIIPTNCSSSPEGHSARKTSLLYYCSFPEQSGLSSNAIHSFIKSSFHTRRKSSGNVFVIAFVHPISHRCPFGTTWLRPSCNLCLVAWPEIVHFPTSMLSDSFM